MLLWRFILTIKKLSKYGIVLVAAVTLTTAVQAQFGQSSTKVYAEETASDANYEDYRMFYAYFAEYPDDPNSGAMSGRVTTVSKPYIVGEEPFGPGSYDIFDITGKHYNVGDVITINEPFLNHKDEEDNRLYYYYHPQNSDNTSEAPAVSTTPATSEAPAVSTTPTTSEAPAASTTPATSEAPAASTTPATSETPAVSTTPATSLVPSKDIHSMNSVTYSSTQTRNAGIKSEADGKLTSHDLPKTGDTNSKVGMLGMVLVGLGLTSFVYKGRHRRS